MSDAVLRNGRGVRLSALAAVSSVVLLIAGCAARPADATFPPPAVSTPAETPRGPQIVFSYGGKVQVAALDARAGEPVAPDVGDGEQTHPDWSPDGDRIVFRADDADGTQDIWTAGLDGWAERLFDCADPCAFADDPAWRPDGGAVLFERLSRVSATSGRFELVVKDLATGAERTVLDLRGSESPYRARWAPDGRRIVTEIDTWASGSIDEERQLGSRIAVLDPASGRLVTLADDASEPDWGAGDRIVFTRDSGTGAELFSVPAAGGAATRLTTSEHGGAARQADWSADGSELVGVQERPPGGAENAFAALFDPATGQAVSVSAFHATHPRLRPTS